MTFMHVLTNFRHLALILLIDRLIHKTTYKVNVVTRNIKHYGTPWAYLEGGPPQSKKFCSGLNSLNSLLPKLQYRDGDLGGEGDRPLKKLALPRPRSHLTAAPRHGPMRVAIVVPPPPPVAAAAPSLSR